MLIYSQSTGIMTRSNGVQIAHGWAGNDYRADTNPSGIKGKNNPAAQNIHCIGPLPQGLYLLDAWESEHPGLGPWVCHLTPSPANEMFGRSGFYIHGPSQTDPDGSSEGCICLLRTDRMSVKQSGESTLQVVQ